MKISYLQEYILYDLRRNFILFKSNVFINFLCGRQGILEVDLPLVAWALDVN